MSVNQSSPPPSEDDMGEDLMDGQGMARDYRPIPELDSYDHANLDSQQFENNIEARVAAERAMQKRDEEAGKRRPAVIGGPMSAPVALLEEDDEPDRLRGFGMDLQEMNYEEAGGIVNLEDFQGPLRDWLAKEEVQIEVRRRFKDFITSFVDEMGETVYTKKISTMCNENKRSLEVVFQHLSQEQPVLGIWIADCPKDLLKIFDSEVMKIISYSYPHYSNIHKSVFVRIVDLPLSDKLRDLRQEHLNAFIRVSGVVTRRTAVFPQLKFVKWNCISCGQVIGPFSEEGDGEPTSPNSCPNCQKKRFMINTQQTLYANYQKLSLQESPGSVPAGRIPRSRQVIVTDDLVDTVRPGEEIVVSGIYTNIYNPSLNMQNGFPVFTTVIEANYISKSSDFLSNQTINEVDERQIKQLAKRPDVEQILCNAIAPSIYGHDFIKRAIIFSLFGGNEKKKGRHRIRGDINVLILGDPGVGKSQFLKYTEKLAPRAVYATGKGATAVGLTASVRKDPMTGQWGLEGGALVLADQGICLIDEFDKMNETDRTSIHEAMEQQSISISKAGIVTTLQARCAVIAAANPIKGRYDSSITFVENVDLGDPILSRFDILAVVRDHVDNVRDEMLADFVVTNHMRSHPKATPDEIKVYSEYMKRITSRTDEEQISQELLRKYIIYGKRHCKPNLSKINREKISSFYADLRQKSMEGGGIPIAVRHIESLLRMAEARAKLHLRDVVEEQDVDVAIRTLLESFIDSQKFAVKKRLEKQFQRYLTKNTDTNSLLMHILQKQVRALQWYRGDTSDELNDIEVDLKEFEARARELEITQLTDFLKSAQFTRAGFVWDRNKGIIRKIFSA